MKSIGLGIIGTGIAARELHWPALAELRDKFTIVRVCNRSPGKARDFAAMIGETLQKEIPWTSDYREILSDPAVEAVDIILPIELNYTACVDAAAAGKHIIAEKPIAHDVPTAEKMRDLERAHPALRMMIAENFRYRRIFKRLAAILGSGTIGRPYFVNWNHFTLMDLSNRYASTPWRIDHAFEGGYVTDGGVHNIAALRDLFGELTLLSALSDCVNPGIGRNDTLSAQFSARWQDPKTGVSSPVAGLFNSCYSAHGISDHSLTILGSTGSVTVKDNTLSWTSSDGERSETFAKDQGYKAEFEDFFEFVRSGKPSASSFSQAIGDLKFILSAFEMASKVQIR